MKKRLPKAQKGLAKLTKVMKTAAKTSKRAGAKVAPKTPVVRKGKRIANAQKSLSKSALTGMTASELRSKLSSLMKEASAASKAKSSGKKLALKQKGGSIGVKPPASLKPKGKEKRRLKKNDRRADRMIKKGGDKATINKMREMAKGPLKGTIATKRQTKKFIKNYKPDAMPVPKTKMQKGGLVNKKRLMGLSSGVDIYLDPKVKKSKKEIAKRKAGLKTTDYAAKFKKSASKVKSKMQKGGPIGKLTPAQKEYLKRVKDPNSITPPGTAKTTKDLKKASKQRGRTVTSKSGLTQRVNRKGVVKKNQGGGRPMSAKKAIRKMTRKRG
jgi:hypothetical protein